MSMIWPMLLMILGYVALYVWLLITRMRSAIDNRKAEGLERRALGAAPSRARLDDERGDQTDAAQGALHG
jgi:hypothetical protein